MAEQYLDDTDIDAILKQMRGEAVPQRMRADRLVDLRCLCSSFNDPAQLPRANRLVTGMPWKQPATCLHHTLGASLLPPRPQQGEQVRREHSVAVAAALALLDPDEHPLAVDICDLEPGNLGHTQTAP